MRIKSPIIHGFTLLELLLVVTLMAVLAAVALATYDGVADQAKYDATKAEMTEIRKALLQFRHDVGDFPAVLGQLSVCAPTDPTTNGTAVCGTWNKDTHRGWNGPYLSNVGADYTFRDAWYDPQITAPTHAYVPKNFKLSNSSPIKWCTEDGSVCQSTQTTTYYVPGNGARIVSTGPNGTYEGDNTTDICEKHDANSDDIVLCLVR